MYTADQMPDSLSDGGACGTRTWEKKSNTNNPRITTQVISHTDTETSTVFLQQAASADEPEVSPAEMAADAPGQGCDDDRHHRGP